MGGQVAGRLAEIDRRRGGDLRLVVDREIRLGLVAEHARGHVLRKRTHEHVVVAHGLDCLLYTSRCV